MWLLIVNKEFVMTIITKIITIIKWIQSKYFELKDKIKQYFLLTNSLNHLENFIKKFCVLSVRFDEIYFRIENPRRFKISFLICAIFWLTKLFIVSLLSSDYMFSMMDIPSIHIQFKKLLLLALSIAIFISVFKTDCLLAEIGENLDALNVIYYLVRDKRDKHKLNDENYKKLAILSRMSQLLLIDVASILILVGFVLFCMIIAILSGKWFWISGTFILTPVVITMTYTVTTITCLMMIIFAYYIMIFRQINDRIKSISNISLKGTNQEALFIKKNNFIKPFSRIRQNQLINLIHQHNQAAIEMHKINLLIRKSLASLFVNFSFIKILSLYLIFHLNNAYIKTLLSLITFVPLIFLFGLTYMLTMQIKLAHQPLTLFQSIVCKYKISLSTKLKVIKQCTARRCSS